MKDLFLGVMMSLVLVFSGGYAVDLNGYVVLRNVCHIEAFAQKMVCDEPFALDHMQLDVTLDDFLDSYVTQLFQEYDADLDLVLLQLDRLRERVAGFSTQSNNPRFLFVVEYLHYRLSQAMEELQ